MVKYSYIVKNPENTAKAHTARVPASYKNTYELCRFLLHRSLHEAISVCAKVAEKKQIVPFRRYTGGIGRQSQAKRYGTNIGRWPVKSAKFVRKILKSVLTNARAKGLDEEKLEIVHINAQRAPKRRRRTFKAHGRIAQYNGNPCHLEVVVAEKIEDLEADNEPKEEVVNPPKELHDGTSAYQVAE